jgi:hypothetical protein
VTITLVDVTLDVLTSAGPLRYTTRFGPGLNVLAAPNSFGKSTLTQSIIFALGLEGMLGASHVPPLGPAMMTVADLPDGGRAGVIESSVTLTCRNGSGTLLRCRRNAVGGDVSTRLIQTWLADSEDDLLTANRIDTYVRMSGSAVQELGFHHVLTEFLGWALPQVPAYRGGESTLYLETLFPLFYVEQKNGWGGVTPRMPTYLGIRDVLQRSVEFVLGLSTLERLRTLAALREELAALRVEWTTVGERVAASARAENLRASTTKAVTGRAQRQPIIVEADVQGSWIPLSTAVAQWSERLTTLEGSRVVTAGERTDQSRSELAEAERAVSRIGAQVRTYTEQAAFVRADIDALSARLASVEADRRRLQDLRRIRELGSDLDISVLSDDLCPTCSQTLDHRHVATGEVASLEDTLLLGDAERTTLLDMRTVAERRLDDLSRGLDALSLQLDFARGQVRLLRDELVRESAAPSLVEVREQLWLRDRIDGANRVAAHTEAANEELDTIADLHDALRVRIKGLEDQPMSEQDRQLLSRFNQKFREQLTRYGLASLPVGQINIDPNTLMPTDDGVELRFDITVGMSASDSIRTKWAYYVALLEAATQSGMGHHAGLLVFDEPRQQETALSSLTALLEELGAAAQQGNQVLYATSGDQAELAAALADIPHSRLPAPGRHLLLPA